MEAWEVEEAVANHFNSLWEDLNDPEKTEEIRYGGTSMPEDTEKIKLADQSLRFAIDCIDNGMDELNEAVEELADTPDGDRLQSLLDDIEMCLDEMRNIQEGFEKKVSA